MPVFRVEGLDHVSFHSKACSLCSNSRNSAVPCYCILLKQDSYRNELYSPATTLIANNEIHLSGWYGCKAFVYLGFKHVISRSSLGDCHMQGGLIGCSVLMRVQRALQRSIQAGEEAPAGEPVQARERGAAGGPEVSAGVRFHPLLLTPSHLPSSGPWLMSCHVQYLVALASFPAARHSFLILREGSGSTARPWTSEASWRCIRRGGWCLLGG
jgi:hypothetical protein